MEYLGNFDEIHRLAEYLIEEYTVDEVVEQIIDILISAYIRGRKLAIQDLGIEQDWLYRMLEDLDEELIDDQMDMPYLMKRVIYKRFKEKDVTQRIREYTEEKKSEELARVIDTEYHRDFNAGLYDLGSEYRAHTGRKVMKTWITMNDEKVRDTHWHIDGMEVDFDKKFYTFDGDSARYPGDFGLAQNNINCRCRIALRTV